MKTLAQLQSSDFAPYLNQTFTIRLEAEGVEPIELELASVTETGQRHSVEARQPFSLHFLGPVSSQYLLQNTYRLEHKEMGALELFLVPLGPELGRMRYEAIFA
jgi:hypothetical protein